MKHAAFPILAPGILARTIATLLGVVTAVGALAAQTDISSSPIISTTAAQVKPNIMLLMDASDSMARTHMPDELEAGGQGVKHIGYKNWQCNTLYYNPAQTYVRPKKADGTFFPVPSFSSAPYAGFGAYYATPDLSTVDLSSSFQAYDTKTLEFPVYTDTAQPAYYYLYSGSTALHYGRAPCTDADSGVSKAASDNSGTWTRVRVSATSGPGATDERQNFAIWYAYYRTRLSMMKSAASLAFTPLTNSFRVGFITVQPKQTPTDSAILPTRYLPINDFDSTQRGQWFDKLFSQRAAGSSPTREGLARVGRHYAGEPQDGINSGMTGDPVQYSCQQNFTILTTDGYWNAQTETPTGGGLFGGPLKKNGVDRVGQQDGDPDCPLTDAFCPRPIRDAGSAATKVTTTKVNTYPFNACGTVSWFESTAQITATTHSVLKNSEKTEQATTKYLETKVRMFAGTTNTTKKVTQITQTTEQYLQTVNQTEEMKYQIRKTEDDTARLSEQYTLTTSQTTAQTSRTDKTVTQWQKREEQWTVARSQNVLTTTQYLHTTSQYTQSKQQVIKEEYVEIGSPMQDENWSPVQGACVPNANYKCKRTTTFGPQAVAPADCRPDSNGYGPNYTKTTCTNGPQTQAATPVASCTPGTSTDPVTFVVTTCTHTVQPAQPINGTCVHNSTTVGANHVITTCTLSQSSTPVASCPGSLPPYDAQNNWVKTTCTQPAGPNNHAAKPAPACSPGSSTDVNHVTTTCAKPLDQTTLVPSCQSNAGSSSPFKKVTCVDLSSTTSGVDPASCTPGLSATMDVTCPSTPAGAYPTATPVQSCTNSYNSGTGITTKCNTTTSTNPVTAAACGPVGTRNGVTPNWQTETCAFKSTTTAALPSSMAGGCSPDAGTSGPHYEKVTCTTHRVTDVQPVLPGACPGGQLGTTVDANKRVTTCSAVNVTRMPANCVPNTVNIGPGPNNWVTRCEGINVTTAVPSCTPGTIPPSSSNNWKETICSNTHAPNGSQFVETCQAQVKDAANAYTQIDCSTATLSTTVNPDPSSCTPVVQNIGSQSQWDPSTKTHTTCTTAAAGPYATPAAVAGTCTATMNPGYWTTCTRPNWGTDNYDNKVVSSCANGPGPTTHPSTHATTTCATDVTKVYVAKASCQPSASVTCTSTPHAVQEKTASCTVGAVSGAPWFDTITSCGQTTPVKNDVASCQAGVGNAPDYLQTVCGSDPKTSGRAVASCTGGTSGSGLVTTCQQTPGSGYKYSLVTTTSVTRTPYSNGLPAGAGTTTASSTPPVDVDGVCHMLPQTFTAQPAPPAGCAAWPCDVMTGGSVGSLDSLADVAQYYYKTDLRPLMPNNVPKIGTGPEDDSAEHQHMTTFVVGLGVSGTLNYRSDYKSASTLTGDFAAIRNGAKDWPLWPDPNIDYSAKENWNDPKSIDDFWHTAVNGRGAYFSARNPTTVVQGLGSALAGISIRQAAGAGDGVSTLEPVVGNNFVYASSYKTSTWTGELLGQEVNLSTGSLVTPPMWSAQARLGARVQASCDSRGIYLVRPGATDNVVEFTWNTDKCPTGTPSGTLVTSLNAQEQAAFGSVNVTQLSQYTEMSDGTLNTVDQRAAAAGAGQGFKLVNFLRGQNGHEDFETNSATKLFRKRDGVLGDIVGSQPVYVKAPFANYADTGYTAFRSANAARTPMVYVGANDGMLHAFQAGQSATDPDGGKEQWALIPTAVLPNLYKLADNNYKNNHQFYVDGTAVAGDVHDGSQWRTILVGGLNAGGKGYYAVDVTDPSVTSPKVLWEFKYSASNCVSASSPTAAAGNSTDCHLGLSFGKPIITKLKVSNVPTWVVMVTSGYNNVSTPADSEDGGGYLYVLNAVTGKIIYKIRTGAGTPSDPSGLTQINNYVADVMVDNTTIRAYGGDLLGNVWRFEFGATPAAKLIGTAKAGNGTAQPITIRPELAELNGKPVVFVGTGRLLGSSDVNDTSQQSIYGIADPLTAGTPVVAADLRTQLRQMSMSTSGTGASTVRQSSCTANCTKTGGWVVDLPAGTGERVNVDMKLVLGTLVVGSNVPESAVCTVGGHSFFNFFDFQTGEAVSTAPLVTSGVPANGRIVSHYLGDSLIGGFNIMRLPPAVGLPDGKFIGQFHMGNSDHLQRETPVGAQAPQGRRISWREIAR